MSIVKYLSLGLAVCAVAVALPWIIKFHGAVSHSPSDWADFGSYIGGTFSSLFAALALIALLYTISQQHRQIQGLRQQASKEDILHAIDRLERDLEKALEGVNVSINYQDGQQTVSARDVLFKPSAMGYKQAIPDQAEIMKEESSGENRENYRSKILLFETFGLAAAELNQIRLYAEGLKKLESKSGTSILSRYYHRKYNLAYSRLYNRGILDKAWVPET
ncbi:hypothetical protein [Marinobacter daepoensis]|uniref:hypothetical protein n=1 Tax=Marinobacter daepoensis TaxID=262077 RepID=UPI0004A3893D|nr:hypothetical protein [Marinobacter daepoensis]